jgi:hypothetical protein
MLVRLFGAGVGCPVSRWRVGVRVLFGGVLMPASVVDQLAMLDASRMLDQQHVAAVRAL